MDTSAFDFKARARSLLKTLSQGAPGAANALNSALSMAAVEAALREVYAEGQQSKRPATTASRSVGARPVETRAPSIAPAAAEPECEHEWDEAFLDGRVLGFRCVACRKPKKPRRA